MTEAKLDNASRPRPRPLHRDIARPVPGLVKSVRNLVENVAAMELLQPSSVIWLVSPAIRDIEVLDNRAGAYRAAGPDLPLTRLRLSRILARAVASGGRLMLYTHQLSESRFLMEQLKGLLPARDLAERVICGERDLLPTVGWLGDDYCLTGSMNFAHADLWHRDDKMTMQTCPQRVEQLRRQFSQSYGAPA